MSQETIIALVTMLVTFVLGEVSKKFKLVNNKLIPLQNILVGIIVSIIQYFITKDFSALIIISAIGTGGAYDIIHNLQKLTEDSEELESIYYNPQMFEPEEDTIEEVEYSEDDTNEE